MSTTRSSQRSKTSSDNHSQTTDITIPSPSPGGQHSAGAQRFNSHAGLLQAVGSGVGATSQASEEARYYHHERTHADNAYAAAWDDAYSQKWLDEPWTPLLYQFDPMQRRYRPSTQGSRISLTTGHNEPSSSGEALRQPQTPYQQPRATANDVSLSLAALNATDLLRQQQYTPSRGEKMAIPRATPPSSSHTSQSSSEPPKPRFYCPDCSTSCIREADLERHRIDLHRLDARCICRDCDYWTTLIRKDSMTRHCRDNHGAKDGAERFDVVQATPSTPSASSNTTSSDDRSSGRRRRRHHG